jgi:hypothetical protein
MKFITTFLLLFLFLSDTLAQDYTSPNLIGNGYSTPTGVVNYTGTGQGYSGGSTPGFNSTNNTIYFGYTQSQVAYTYAFSQALQNSGMTILGYNYGWSYLNEGTTAGNLSAAVNFASTTGASLHYKSWTLGTTNGWTNISGTETFTSPGLSAANIANFSLTFNGKDNRFWAGYYGPQVKDPSLTLNYTFDACSSNPLSSPSCPGYAAALLSQQCSINALYDPSCPGYATAYMTQQCSVNALYDPSCPGYAAAYFTQQCNLNPLYNSACPGYAAAYKTQQCNLNPLYDSSCSGYAAAYKTQQCNLDGLYATDCPNYAEAYAKKNILGVGTTTTSTTTTSATTVSTTQPTVQVRSDGKVDSTSVPLVSDSNVNNVITTTTTSSTPSATAAVPLVSTPTTSPQGVSSVNTQTSTTQTSTRQEQTAAPAPSGQRTTEAKAESKSDQQKMKDSATAKAKEEMQKASKATSMEAQVATQNAVVGLMSFVPGFVSYTNSMIVDYNQIKMQRQYEKDTVDNRRVLRMLNGASDRIHSEMVDSQYNLGN